MDLNRSLSACQSSAFNYRLAKSADHACYLRVYMYICMYHFFVTLQDGACGHACRTCLPVAFQKCCPVMMFVSFCLIKVAMKSCYIKVLNLSCAQM